METSRKAIAGIITAFIMATTIMLFLLTLHLLKSQKRFIVKNGVVLSKGDTLRGGFYYED